MPVLTSDQRAALIAAAKSRESKENIIALIGNLPTMRLILAWPTVTICIDPKFDPRAKGQGGANLSQMSDAKKIWVGVELDFDEIAAVMRTSRPLAELHTREAQMNLWVYPDNTVHAQARELAKATMVKVAKGGRSD